MLVMFLCLAIIVEKGELYCDCVNDLPEFGMNPKASELVMKPDSLGVAALSRL